METIQKASAETLDTLTTADAIDMHTAIIESARCYLREDKTPRARMLANALYCSLGIVLETFNRPTPDP